MIDISGRTALHYAIDQGDAAAVKYLVEHNADVDARQSHYLQDPPLIKALQRNDQDIVSILVDGKADTECMNKSGWRPLHFAARNGNTGLASRLLDLGCERQPQTHLGETPFFLALAWNRSNVIELFMKNDVGISDVETFQGSTYAHVLADIGRLDILRELVQTDNSIIFKTTASGVDPLYLAANSGLHTVVEFLVRSGMEPGGMGCYISTPLAAAAENGCIKTVGVLLSFGAEVDQTDVWQRTPLLRAVEGGHLNVAHHLLKAGANPHIRDATGFSAFDYCIDNSAMMDVLRPWRSIPPTHGMAQNSDDRLFGLTQCISRSARAIADRRRDALIGDSRLNGTGWHLLNICSFLFRLALAPFPPPRLPAQKTHTAVPAKKTEILREWRIIVADSDALMFCSFCDDHLQQDFYTCTMCLSVLCGACHSQLSLGTQPHARVKVWTELRQMEKDMIPISTVLRGLAYQDSSVVGEVLSQDNILRRWVLAKRQEYATWRKCWGLHHFRNVHLHGYNLVHTMARVLSHEKDRHMSEDESASDTIDIEHCNVMEETRSGLTEQWQDIFFYWSIDEDLNSEPCTHSCFLKASKQHQSLREPQVVFDSEDKLTSETFDRIAEKYEDCLAGGDLTLEKLQTRRFTDSAVETSDNGNKQSEPAMREELFHPPGAGADSGDETSSLDSASDTSSDVTHVSEVSDVGGELQFDIEETLEKLLVKRRILQKEKPLTDKDELVLETAWKFVQAIIYHDTPRQSLKDIAEQGGEWHTAPGTPIAFGSGGVSNDSSHYSTAGSI